MGQPSVVPRLSALESHDHAVLSSPNQGWVEVGVKEVCNEPEEARDLWPQAWLPLTRPWVGVWQDLWFLLSKDQGACQGSAHRPLGHVASDGRATSVPSLGSPDTD